MLSRRVDEIPDEYIQPAQSAKNDRNNYKGEKKDDEEESNSEYEIMNGPVYHLYEMPDADGTYK